MEHLHTLYVLPVISGQRIKVQPPTEISGIIMRNKARKPNMKGESALKAALLIQRKQQWDGYVSN
jgi:hypothetical protein